MKYIVLLVLLVVAIGMLASDPTATQGSTTGTREDYVQLARQDAQDAGLDPDIFERQIRQESGFRPDALSPAGAIGIAQIIPSTARAWGVNPWNPNDALRAAAYHMRLYLNAYRSYAKALGCYNAGCAAVDWAIKHCSNWSFCLPGETRNYIAIILQ